MTINGTNVKIKKTEKNNAYCVVAEGDNIIISDTQSALDLLMTAGYETGIKNIAVAKERVDGKFFVLSSGLAGEILQEFINYGGRIAIYGDFSQHISKPLRSFIYECNHGSDVFFVSTKDEAIDMLTRQF